MLESLLHFWPILVFVLTGVLSVMTWVGKRTLTALDGINTKLEQTNKALAGLQQSLAVHAEKLNGHLLADDLRFAALEHRLDRTERAA